MLPTLLAIALVASATASDPIATDRPTASYSSKVAGEGRTIIETGIDYARSSDTFSLPTSLRFGVSSGLEVRLDNVIVSVNDDGVHASDLSIGLKAHICDGVGICPSTGLLVDVLVPIEGSVLVPRVLALMDWDLPLGFGGSVNVGLTRALTDDAEVVVPYAAGLSHGIVGDFTGILSYSGSVDVDGESDHQLTGALLFLATDDLQLDVVARFNLEEAKAFVLGAGLGWRI